MLLSLEKLYPWSEGLTPLLSDYCEEVLTRQEYESIQDFFAETDFYTAPASTRFHLSCPQGLMTHTLNVVRAADELINDEEAYISLPSSWQAFRYKLIKCAILHDICKVDTYKPAVFNFKEYTPDGDKSDALGKFKWSQSIRYNYEVNFDLGHGSKSVFLAEALGITLSKEEAQAIYYHMGDFQNMPETSKVFSENPLSLLLHMADLYANSALDLSAEESQKYSRECLQKNPAIYQ